jgi:hypothetical protein
VCTLPAATGLVLLLAAGARAAAGQQGHRVLESLAGLLDTVSGGSGPLTVLFFSTSLAGPRRDAPVTMAPGMCELTKDHFEAVGNAAGRARANFYVIQPEDATPLVTAQAETIGGAGFTGSDNPLVGLENLAGVTGGERLHLATTSAALTRVLADTASYYVAALEPLATDRPGTRHLLEIRVARDRVAIRARPSVQFERTASAPPARTSPREMLRRTATASAVPLRVAGYVSRHAPDGTVKIVSLAEPTDGAARLASIAAGLVTPEGRLIAQWAADDPAARPILGALPAPPGQYRLRVAAVDTAGRAGTADYDVVAQLTPAGPLALSSIVLGLSRDGGFLPRLQFGSEPVALASLEMFGGTPGARVTATLELARTEDGPAIATVPLAIASGGDDRYVATGAVPIGALPGGDFVVRAIVGIEGQPAGRVVRTLRKVMVAAQ